MSQEPQPVAGQEHPEPQSEVELLSARIDELQMALMMVREEQLRERADLENQRKRMLRDVEHARKFANERLLGDLLPVLDALERGIETAGSDSAVAEGLKLTQRELLKVAESNGLKQLNPAGEAFNPEHHQAVSAQPSAEYAAGTVLQVFQKGYLLNERLLRPAMVVVSQ
ncbi:nucleotide exchange factor GrpE [uncultured Aquimonas sp.]|uniref:nucleotide exchange factor GrpE n=1 Tax=uncultured Aquimonas sp. TaxID=385483 RepID=UPI00086BE4DE|nr:nucleotide exchange factor GrpE [uncultured Aquimonas sp.]ODU45349.1 MAG: nucleotide exchange factor GrpE [Xanthomonadaceae bacterium SCN 69-123]